MSRKKLTRQEIWSAIISKYPTLCYLNIDCKFKEWGSYVQRPKLFRILIQMKLHKSRHLTKAQKEKVKYELNEMIFNKI